MSTKENEQINKEELKKLKALGIKFTKTILKSAKTLDESVTELVLPDGTTAIDKNAFSGCKKLTGIKLPNSLTKIAAGAFKDCISMTHVEFADGIKKIEKNAFSGCKKLTKIELPTEAIFIDEDAFPVGVEITFRDTPGKGYTVTELLKKKNLQLLEAICEEDSKGVKAALDSGARANGRDSKKHPFMHVAVFYRNVDAIKLLLEYGAHVDIRDSWGNCALHRECGGGLRLSSDVLEGLCLLLARGLNIDTKNNDDMTPLYTNCCGEDNSIDIIEFFIENGADVNAQDEANGTPLLAAVEISRVDMVKLLLKHGAAASINICERFGSTPLERARERVEEEPGNKKCREVLQLLEQALKAAK